MNSKAQVAINLLLAFREELDAAQLIAEYLKVEEMSPRDRSVTRQETKIFLRFGDNKRAEDLLRDAEARRNQGRVLKIIQQRRKSTKG